MGVIRTEFTFGNRHGWQEKKIVVQTDVRGAESTVLRLRVYIPPTATLQPLALRWTAGETLTEKTIRIKIIRPEPFNIISAMADDPYCTVTLTPITEGREYQLAGKPTRLDQSGRPGILPGGG